MGFIGISNMNNSQIAASFLHVGIDGIEWKIFLFSGEIEYLKC